MKIGLRGRFFAVSLSLIVVAGLVSGVYLERQLRRWLEGRTELVLVRHAQAARDLIEVAAPTHTIEAIDPLADRMGRSTEARITVVAEDGRVLGDSQLEAAKLPQVQNHATRPEVRGAIERGGGRARRYSTTVSTHMLYVAVPYRGPIGQGVVRASLALSEVDRAIWRLRLVLLFAALIGLGLAVVVGALTSHFFSRDVRRLVESARAKARGAASGEGVRSLTIPGSGELRRLAVSFNQLIEELNAAVAKLARERDRLSTILESMSEGVLALDAEQRITQVNHAATDLLALSPSPIGQPLLEVVRAPALAELAVAAAAHEAAAEFELAGSRSLLARGAPLRTTGGCVVVLHDVSEMRRLEVVRRDFVANVSHELRTPVSVVQANAETLLDAALEDPKRARAFVEAVHRNAERLSRIIADLLDLSRIEAGEYELGLGATDVGAAVGRVVESLERGAKDKGLAVEVDVPSGTKVIADSRALEQVLVNLLDNSLKYTPERGRIVVRARAEGGQVRLEVADDGPGIEAHHRERVFERFYRVDPGRSRDVGGTGLGLSICKHLIGVMKGELGMRPNDPHGSIFWLLLPSSE